MQNPRRLALIALAAIMLAALTIVSLTAGDDPSTRSGPSSPGAAPVVPATVGVDATGDGTPDKVLELDREAIEVAGNATRTPDHYDMAGDLRGDDPTPVGQLDGPLAAPHWPGCSTRFLPTNFSNRVSAVRAVGLHYTAGLNRPGLSDMNGLTAYASSPAAGVSWHFLIDAEGHCYYNVPTAKKAWTIGNLNSQTVNIEVIGTGRERTYPAFTPGARRLSQVVRRIGRVYRIPMRLGATDGRCSVTRPGIITHWQGGACSGGHSDIRPYDIADVARRIAGDVCGRSCRIRRDHAAAHKRLRDLDCRGPGRERHPAACRKANARNRAAHADAREAGLTL